MAQQRLYIASEKYRYIRGYSNDTKKEPSWHVNMQGVSMGKFATEKEAARAVDLYLIGQGREPVNVLKKLRTNVK